jgi:hypothetical protein
VPHVSAAGTYCNILELLKQVVGHLGWTGDAVASGLDAWEPLKRPWPDLLALYNE